MRKMIIAVVAIISIILGVVIYHNETMDYINTIDYHVINGYGVYDTVNKDSLVKELISEDGMIIYDYYDDFVVIYLKQDNGRIRFSRMQFNTDAYSFGKNHITIGTSKTKVEKLLRKSKKSSPEGTNYYMVDDDGQLLDLTAYEYIDSEYDHGFTVAYDEDDKVSYISIWFGLN